MRIYRFRRRPSSAMFRWRVILMAALAVLLLLGGFSALIVPDEHEGPELHTFDENHAVCALDALGGALLMLGSVVAWGAGAVWQRQMYAS